MCNLPEICFIIFHTEPMSTGISLLFVTTAGSIGLLCPYVRCLSSQVMHLIPSMSETQWESQMPPEIRVQVFLPAKFG